MRKIYLIREKSSKFGGAEVYLSRLVNALKNQGIDCQIVNSIFPSFLPSWLRIILFNLQVCLTKNNRFYFSLERIVCPDIYRAGDGVHKVFLSIENKSKLNPLHPVYLYLEKHCFNNAKHIIANSNIIKDEIINTYGVNSNKIDVIYNGVESKKIVYQDSFDRLSKEFGLREQDKLLLHVGSGFKRKGVEGFLTIISKLVDHNIKAFVIGKEKDIAYYKELSKSLNINNQVFFTGPREDVNDFYTVCDVFILATHYEPFGNVVLEAMSYNNAVITTKMCGANFLLDDKFIMTNPNDITIVSVINNLLENDGYLQEIKDINYKKSLDFTIEKNAEETIELINKVIQDE